jgi:hypothetical protein
MMAAPVPSDQAGAEMSISNAGSARWQAPKLVLRELYMLQQPGKARALNACISLVTMAMLMRHA